MAWLLAGYGRLFVLLFTCRTTVSSRSFLSSFRLLFGSFLGSVFPASFRKAYGFWEVNSSYALFSAYVLEGRLRGRNLVILWSIQDQGSSQDWRSRILVGCFWGLMAVAKGLRFFSCFIFPWSFLHFSPVRCSPLYFLLCFSASLTGFDGYYVTPIA